MKVSRYSGEFGEVKRPPPLELVVCYRGVGDLRRGR